MQKNATQTESTGNTVSLKVPTEQHWALKVSQFDLIVHEIIHELRSPLAGLKMACEQLARNPANQELALSVARAFPKQVDKLYQLTADLLKCSKDLSNCLK